MDNRKAGNTFESLFCEILSKYGFWVHNFAQNQAGQPADVIAVKNDRAYLIDCKICSTQGFLFRRVEENQHNAMTLWRECSNHETWFALYINSEIYMIEFTEIQKMQDEGLKRISGKDIQKNIATLKDWLGLR